MMKLSDTCELMCSEDYRQRFIAEYKQLEIRYDSLCRMISDCILGKLNFEPKCSIGIKKKKKYVMEEYMEVLRQRAVIEHISLS